MNNNNKFLNKTGYNKTKNEAHKETQKENYNKNASKSGAMGQKDVEPKHGKMESSKEYKQNSSSEYNRK